MLPIHGANPLPRLRKTILWLIAAGVAAGAGLAGLYSLPVSLALGPCLMDLTNVNTYRRRSSPLASSALPLGQGAVKVCYGRPSAKGRVIYGALIPYGEYWRFGANEPTRLYTDVPLVLAGMALPPGRYSLYAFPGPDRWEIAVNRSTRHWGRELSGRVLALEVGRATLPVRPTFRFVETFTMTLVPAGDRDHATLVADWERTRLEIPLAAGPPPLPR